MNPRGWLSIPEEVWIHVVSVAYPETVFRVIAVLSGEESGIALLEIRTPNPVPIIRRRAVVPAKGYSSPYQTPFEVTDGTAIWEITTSSERLSTLGTRLDEAGIGFDIEYVHDDPSDPAECLLTDRQRELLLTAAEQGYYDTPRRATLTEVSESPGISKATGSDVLRWAEGAVLKWFIDEHLAVGGVPERAVPIPGE